jgi:septal ring factor EnvC (AmiA/AmiB activator)
MNKEKTLFLAGALFVQLGAVAIHWGLALALLGVWCLMASYAEYCEREQEDKESTALADAKFTADQLREKIQTTQKLYEELSDMYNKQGERIKILTAERDGVERIADTLRKENADLTERIEKLTSEPKANTD